MAFPAHGADGAPGRKPQEIPDSELSLMRGRYTVGGNAVAWFGVTMISTWQTASGQQLQGALTLAMDFGDGKVPRISFTPSVSITAVDAPLPDTGGRSIGGSGLRNVAGLVQSVQVAGDGNQASNAMQLTVRDAGASPGDGGDASGGQAAQRMDGASAVAGFDGEAARVLLQIDGQGAVEQWLRSGSVGQRIALAGDGQQAANRLRIDLVRQGPAGNLPLAQNVAQAITLIRAGGVGAGY
ncbi:hypothetical protein [Stenotrophomonas sp. MYb238]|uniref:hypothetical protein n=1 Tax=Stenotrophomonas sp. MYb238 TaxID=2040281 RepID=UPI001D1777ED|nr:hypothetical protein [Stenotrophomonas sp. MYb238]